MKALVLFRKPSRDSGKDLIYVSLASAIEEGGCPICRLVAKVEVDALRSLLYEHVNDPHVRKLIVSGWGLCQYHSWLMARLAIEDPSLGGGLGPAIIMEDLVERFLNEVSQGRVPEAGSGCYVCRQVAEFELMYVESLAKRFETTDLLGKYEGNSSSILCSKHFKQVAERVREVGVRDKLFEIQRAKLGRLGELLRRYIDKHDYRCGEPITKEEAESWLLAIESLVGTKSLLSGLYRRV